MPQMRTVELYSPLPFIYRELRNSPATRRAPGRGGTCPPAPPLAMTACPAAPPPVAPPTAPAPSTHPDRGRVRLDHRVPHRRPDGARPLPRRGRATGGRVGGRGRRRHRGRAVRWRPAPGQRPFRRADRRHGRADPDLRLAHHLCDHHRRRTPPDPPGHPESRAQRARRQPCDRARDAHRHRRGHRARPAPHHAGQVAAEFRRRQRPRAARSVGRDRRGGSAHRGADRRRRAALAPAAGAGRTDGAENPGRPGDVADTPTAAAAHSCCRPWTPGATTTATTTPQNPPTARTPAPAATTRWPRRSSTRWRCCGSSPSPSAGTPTAVPCRRCSGASRRPVRTRRAPRCGGGCGTVCRAWSGWRHAVTPGHGSPVGRPPTRSSSSVSPTWSSSWSICGRTRPWRGGSPRERSNCTACTSTSVRRRHIC